MRNRAKCKKCNSVIESFHATDYVICNCGEIGVDGGEAMRCTAKDWSNFVRLDEQDNEIVVKVIDKTDKANEIDVEPGKQSKQDIIDMIVQMRLGIERLPQHALEQPITHYDLMSLLLLLEAIFKAD